MLNEILWRQNYFWRGVKKEIVPRNSYLETLKQDLAQKEVLLLMGPRRVGKTYLMYALIQDLIDQGVSKNQILYCILNDYELKDVKISEIIQEFRTIWGLGIDEKIYVFLDEVQYVKDWDQQVVNFYDTQNVKIVVSGSSSILIKNQSTFLTGRQLKHTIYPLDFKEFLEFKKYKPEPYQTYLYQSYLLQYFEIGGFPDMVLNPNSLYLSDLIDAILYKDIVSVYNLDQPKLLKEILIWMSVHLRQSTSYNKLTKVLNQKSDVTIKQYVEYLKDVYQIMEVRRFSKSFSEQLISPRKYYFADLGTRNNLIQGFKDAGSVAENVLYLHLCRIYGVENVFYFYENRLEVDFIVKHLDSYLAFESKYTDDISYDSKGLNGIKSLFKKTTDTNFKLQKIVVVTKDTKKLENGIEFVPLHELLLGQFSI